MKLNANEAPAEFNVHKLIPNTEVHLYACIKPHYIKTYRRWGGGCMQTVCSDPLHMVDKGEWTNLRTVLLQKIQLREHTRYEAGWKVKTCAGNGGIQEVHRIARNESLVFEVVKSKICIRFVLFPSIQPDQRSSVREIVS